VLAAVTGAAARRRVLGGGSGTPRSSRAAAVHPMDSDVEAPGSAAVVPINLDGSPLPSLPVGQAAATEGLGALPVVDGSPRPAQSQATAVTASATPASVPQAVVPHSDTSSESRSARSSVGAGGAGGGARPGASGSAAAALLALGDSMESQDSLGDGGLEEAPAVYETPRTELRNAQSRRAEVQSLLLQRLRERREVEEAQAEAAERRRRWGTVFTAHPSLNVATIAAL
jgi:hypothetical protein